MMNMRKALLVGCLLGTAAAVAQGDFRVAGPDGAAIQRAVDRAAAAGGGRVVVPAGDYPSGSLRLYSHVEVYSNNNIAITRKLQEVNVIHCRMETRIDKFIGMGRIIGIPDAVTV